MKIDPQQLKAFLIDGKLVTKKQYDECVEKSKESNQKIGDILVLDGLLTEEQLASAQAYLSGIPFMNIENEIIPPEILKIIPEQIAKAHNIIAFKKNGNNLEVAMVDPDDLRTIEFIKKTSPSLNILPRLTTPEGIKGVLRQYQKTLETEFGDIIKKEAGAIKIIKKDGLDALKSTEDLKKAAEELPVVRIVDALMKQAILQRASDVHIEPSEEQVIVRYRIDGLLKDVMALPVTAAAGIVARIKVLSDLKLDEHRLPQDGRFKITSEDYKFSVRVSVLPVFNGEKIVMRLLAEGSKSYSLESIGLLGAALENVRDNLAKPSGMILVTGPTGSGKTTTLYGMMEILNTRDVNISTVEDPIEYRMPRVNQTQVNSKIGLTFVSGLRSLVRQDPDIIMVGEIRDKETASLAINAALTGHQVLSTLHTTSAAGAIPRLIDMGCEPFLLSSTLNVIIAQRLVRKFDGPKEQYKLTSEEIKNIKKYCNLKRILQILKQEKLATDKTAIEEVNFYRAKPSKDSPDGYQGRIGIFEVLPVTEEIKKMIVKKATSKSISDQAVKDGMRTMIEDGFVKAVKGVTSLEEILRVITE